MSYSDIFIRLLKLGSTSGKISYALARKKTETVLRDEVFSLTSFLSTDISLKERCEYILQSKYEPHTCNCGCGASISIFNKYLPHHDRRDPERMANWQAKMTNTLQEKYGDDFGKIRLAHAVDTNIKRYGTKYTTQVEHVKLKMQATTLKNYGVINCSKSDIIKQKKRNTYKNNYSTDYNHSPIVNEKIRLSRYQNTYNRFDRFSSVVTPNFTMSDFTGGGYFKFYSWHCQRCDSDFDNYYNNGQVPRCTVCYPPNASSIPQTEIIDFISGIYDGEICTNDRTIIAPLELDIYLPDLNLAIEFNGLYWHSEEAGKGKHYHLNKTQLCLSKGIRLIHLFEDEWCNKQDIIKSKLCNLITKSNTKIYARQCTVDVITPSQKKFFLENNHIQGNDKSTIHIGLSYNNTLVAVMTFGKSRFNKQYEYELIRFCTLQNHTITGAGSKLLNYFIRNYSPKSIISYADKRWTSPDINLYTHMGFALLHHSTPNYFYFRNNVRESRMKYQKHKLDKILPGFNASLSESENMALAGFRKIWDCGNLVYGIHL